MPGAESNIRDATGQFGGRRYWFPEHWVAEVDGQPYCGVVGEVWDTAKHVEGKSVSANPEGYTILSEGNKGVDPTKCKLEFALPMGFGIALEEGNLKRIIVKVKMPEDANNT